MRSLTFTKQETTTAECPPEDVYTLELVTIGEFEEKPAYKFNPDDPDVVNTQSRFTFKIVDFDYDPDMDDRDWNGAEVSDFFVFFKHYVESGKDTETWKNEKANSNKLIKALVGRDLEDGEDIDLPGLVGRRIKATVAPKSSGWPKISNPMKTRQRKAAKTKGLGPFGDGDEEEVA